MELLVFIVTPFKIDQNKNQNRSIKSRIWEMKGVTYTKTLAKIQVRGIFRIRDIRRNVLLKLTLLPYMAYTEICRWTGYGFRPVCPKHGIQLFKFRASLS